MKRYFFIFIFVELFNCSLSGQINIVQSSLKYVYNQDNIEYKRYCVKNNTDEIIYLWIDNFDYGQNKKDVDIVTKIKKYFFLVPQGGDFSFFDLATDIFSSESKFITIIGYTFLTKIDKGNEFNIYSPSHNDLENNIIIVFEYELVKYVGKMNKFEHLLFQSDAVIL